MARHGKPIAFAAQSAIVGLAIAFVAVLVKPDIAHLERISSRGSQSYAGAVAASSPAVVTIYTERSFNPPGQPAGVTLRDQALGSGVVISPKGYVVTNWHVIKGADMIRVQLADGRVAVPTIVGADPDTELALLHIDLDRLPTIALGRSDSLKVGDVVLAIGNSLGLCQTVTMGIVSATGRTALGLTNFEDFIQTDAAINMGNSGGALVNARGELVGINTAVVSSAGEIDPPEGIGFAIPVNLVRGVMNEIIEHGHVIRGYLGIDTVDLSAAYTARLGIKGAGVGLRAVEGPAAAAGLKPGDVLVAINGKRMQSSRAAMQLVASSKPGARIGVTVVRADGTRFDAQAVLEERPPVDTN
jgi:serine protease DegS